MVYTTELAPNLTSDATYRALCLGIATGLAAIGMVQSGDTGQADFVSGETKPGTSNTFNHYQIWRFADASSGTADIYLKIEFGTGSTSSNFGLRLSFADATNGSGALGGGSFTSQTQTLALQRNSASTIPCVFCGNGTGGTSSIQICLFTSEVSTFASFPMFFALSRGINASGDFSHTNLGVNLISACEGTRSQQYGNATVGSTNPSAAVQTAWMHYGPPSPYYDDFVGFYPILRNSGPVERFDLSTFIFFKDALRRGGNPISLMIEGVTHTYLPITNTSASLTMGNGSSAQMCILMRYE